MVVGRVNRSGDYIREAGFDLCFEKEVGRAWRGRRDTQANTPGKRTSLRQVWVMPSIRITSGEYEKRCWIERAGQGHSE